LLTFLVPLLASIDARASPQRAKAEQIKHASTAPKQNAAVVPLPAARPAVADLPPDLKSVKQALELVRGDKLVEATALEKSVSDPAAQKLIEWALLRQTDGGAGSKRYWVFISANPAWPSLPLLRKRAEIMLWKERSAASEARSFFIDRPVSPTGRLVLARVLMAGGDRTSAASEVRSVWRSAPLSAELETATLSDFPGVLTGSDHLARMDKRIGAKDFAAAMRAANLVGNNHGAIVKACAATAQKSANAGKLLDAVPSQARDDLGYALCRIQWLLRNDAPGFNIRGHIVTPKEDVTVAVKLALEGSEDGLQQQDTDEWWRQRRALARKLLDLDDAKDAYQVVAKSALPANPHYRAEFHFMAGWIALRFLNDPATAAKHFALVDEGASDPRIIARAAYWRGRAAESQGQTAEMRAQYEAAGHFPTAYYGQLARARLGLAGADLRSIEHPQDPTKSELLQAASILYAVEERELVLSFVSDIAKENGDAAVIDGLAKLAAQHQDAHATMVIGEAALARGMAMDQYAYPDFGVPLYTGGPTIDRSVLFAIVRTESAFDQRDKSSANAVGLMQVTPGAGRDTAKRFGILYDWRRVVSDPVYNTEMGAGEAAALLKEYGGSYILTFAAYNAGRDRVRQWMALHGDPRDPKIDSVDWVERIPFAETRNYVQRVIENLQIYRARFGS
jgi:soluble lytic murein transglycosylase